MIDKSTFKYYCRYLIKYRKNDLAYPPWQIDFAEDVVSDKSFPIKSWYRRPENNSFANDEYKKAIENHLEKMKACDAAKEAFQILWKDYIRFTWMK